jgi:hypothetical protein
VHSIATIEPCKDPITRIIFGKYGYKVVYFWVGCHVIFILTALHYGTVTKIVLPFELSVNPVLVPLSRDKNLYVFFFLGILGIILTNQVLNAVPGTFSNLWKNNILKIKTETEKPLQEYERQLKKLERKVNSRKSYVFAIIYTAVSFVFVFIDFYRIPKTESPVIVFGDIRVFPLSGIAIHATYAFVYFILIIVVYKGVLLVHFLRKLHETFDFQVNPLIDRCGGLKPIGDFCIGINYIIFLLFAVIVSFLAFPHSKELDYAIYFGLSVYIFLAIFFFVYPIWPIHETMKKQKEEIVARLRERLGQSYQEELSRIERSAKSDYDSLRSRRKPRSLYEMANVMQVWPFEISGLLLFLTALLVPTVSVAAIAVGAQESIQLFTTSLIPAVNVLLKILLRPLSVSGK